MNEKKRAPLSFSMVIDKMNENETNQDISSSDIPTPVLPRTTYSWLNDKAISNCFICKKLFNFLNRKHHCRSCGRIFCYYCSNNYIRYPRINHMTLIKRDDYLYFWSSGITYKQFKDLPLHRVCIDCKNIYRKIKKTAELTKILELLPLTINDYLKMKCVSKDWYQASVLILSRFREIQYLLPFHDYSIFQKSILNNNYKELICHSNYLKHFIKSCNWDDKSNEEINDFIHLVKNTKKSKDCWKLMCSRNCSVNFKDDDVIDILMSVKNDLIREFILKFLTKKEEKLFCYLPVLTYSCRLDGKLNPISKFLIGKSIIYADIRLYLYWELKVQLEETQYYEKYNSIYQKFLGKMIETFGLQEINRLNQLADFNDIICENAWKIKKTKNVDELKEELRVKDIQLTYAPFNTKYKINKINIDEIGVKTSASLPIWIPFNTQDNNKKIVMFKTEDVRKDRIITLAISLMDQILKEDGMDMDITTYRVLPTSMNNGFIEIIDNSTTIYEIQKMNYTIQNYIMEKNSSHIIADVRKRIIKSTAAYCVITYLLGIGDRHLDNILITDEGRLFHIDFSFILGKDPKPMAPEIRLTQEMVNSLGGENSKSFKKFKNYCSLCYDSIRRRPNIFINLLYLMSRIDKKNLNIDIIKNEVINRFLPGEYTGQASLHFDTKIKNSRSASNFIDFVHYHYKEKTITSGIGSIFNNLSVGAYSIKSTIGSILTRNTNNEDDSFEDFLNEISDK